MEGVIEWLQVIRPSAASGVNVAPSEHAHMWDAQCAHIHQIKQIYEKRAAE